MARTMIVHFVESAVPEALEALSKLGQELTRHPDCLRAELLASTRQADLCLLMSEWRTEPQLALPAQVKSWIFRAVSPANS